ncbi:3-hydroxyacyl-CoA dehydrogenase/enoyl-CoA hydratase family protein [Rhodopila globiformis]|uniref:3-hydroxyacyl-CoA dehydrogenase n=1 Tax=Rhodopila globiformis TaxID=1071 RepID=A0A2S6N9G3_RHOGL|nr:3-hydroxyacyl-CoA dehydrogenase/enoyl-CoA hydratase family protein [Rhodopila globiformis]PPQ31253.1 3-hydroxyacyl-CoA dehydrogenase [Rhodopila globiformis]
MAAAIRRVGVIGAGTMGAGIAAQVANAGVPVALLDIVPPDATNRNVLAETALARLRKAEPAAFMHDAAAKLVTIGNLEDDLGKLADCDWIIEAVLERVDIKQALYRRLEAVHRPGCAISSNTSTIGLKLLTEGLSEAFRRDFLITHFFNPPRYMRLLEIVTGPETSPETVEAVTRFADVALGKSIVHCADSPGFIANRLGIYWLQLALTEAIDQGLTVEEADAIVGPPMGIPKTGVFGLMDLVGIDMGPLVNASMRAVLPKSDAFHRIDRDVPLVTRMIGQGLTGRKGKGGFYRLDRAAGGRAKQAIDLQTGDYRPERKPALPEIEAAGRDLRALLASPGKAGTYAFRVLAQTIAYAATLVPDVAESIADVDEAMRLGYAWTWGPFELADKLGTAWLVDQLAAQGMDVPALLRDAAGRSFYRVEAGKRQYLGTDGEYHDIVRAPGVLLLADIKLASKPVLRNASAALWDIGDGVACFEFTGKSNALDDKTIELLGQSIEVVRSRFKALVIYNEGSNFSLGANLGLALFAANIAAWGEIEKQIAAGQKTYKALKYAPFPVVAAPSGMALGGGCEIILHSDAVQAHAESYIGLVECGVGLVPGWGGCGEMLARWRAEPKLPRGPMPAPAKVFEGVSTADVSKSAHQAMEKHFLRPTDGITMNRDRLLADAKQRALGLVDGYKPPEPPTFVLPGPSGRAGLYSAALGFHRRGLATDHDLVVADALAEVLSGGDTDIIDTVDEQAMLDLERRAFMRLARTAPTLARIEHTLETGKPLRN